VKVRLRIAYHGYRFHGWQIQSDVRTVEGDLTEAVAKLVGQRVKVQGASRTDSGVHAEGQVACFSDDGTRPVEDYYRALNHLTRDDVAVLDVERVNEDFNARHSARGKIYEYFICDTFHVHPMHADRVWHVPRHLNAEAMTEAGERLVGTHDFRSFQASGCEAKTTIKTLRRVEARRLDNGLISVVVEGNSFLKYMVRNLVGTLVAVGKERKSVDWIDEVLAATDRQAAGNKAPAKGLVLQSVLYPLR
jgi:tRNA pseudouridine38-40 synthase